MGALGEVVAATGVREPPSEAGVELPQEASSDEIRVSRRILRILRWGMKRGATP